MVNYCNESISLSLLHWTGTSTLVSSLCHPRDTSHLTPFQVHKLFYPTKEPFLFYCRALIDEFPTRVCAEYFDRPKIVLIVYSREGLVVFC